MQKKFGTCLLAGALASLLLPTGVVVAQRDAGAKLRGDIGRYSGRTAQPRSAAPRPSYRARPGAVQPGPTAVRPQPQTETSEAYSIEPLPFEIGDEVRIASDSAQLMRGRRSLGAVPGGQQLRVLQIRGPWVGVAAEIDGREVGGWLWYSQVASAR